MRINTLCLVAGGVLTAGSSLAAADTINATFTGVGPGEAVGVVLNANPTSTTAGGFNWTRTGGTLPGFSPTFVTFCIDLTQFISNGGSYSYETFAAGSAPTSGIGAMGPVRAGYMARLFADHYSSLSTSGNYAGFQLAVWEIAFDGDLNLGTGNFTVSSASVGALASANAYLSTVNLAGPTWPVFAIDDPTGSTTNIQGQMMIPTPGAMALMGLGGLAATRRRR